MAQNIGACTKIRSISSIGKSEGSIAALTLTSSLGHVKASFPATLAPSESRTLRVSLPQTTKQKHHPNGWSFYFGAGEGSRTPVNGLEGRGNSHYTTPARCCASGALFISSHILRCCARFFKRIFACHDINYQLH
jgi:hypothetical protein